MLDVLAGSSCANGFISCEKMTFVKDRVSNL